MNVLSVEEWVQDLTYLARFAVEKSLIEFGQLLRSPLGTALWGGWERDTWLKSCLRLLVKNTLGGVGRVSSDLEYSFAWILCTREL